MASMNATAQYRELGDELRKRRVAAGLSLDDLATRIGWSRSKVWRAEAGYTELDPADYVHYLGLCGIYRGQAMDLMTRCREAMRKTGHWLTPLGERLSDAFTSLIFHESTSTEATTYAPQLVPGLLQTVEYARARIGHERWRSRDQVEEFVRIRMERQRTLFAPHTAKKTFFVHEQALRLQVGSAAIMHEQLLKIVLFADLKQITVRVMPLSAGERSAVGGSFALFGYRRHAPLVYLDHHSFGLFLEDRRYVDTYCKLVPDLADVALDVKQSRALIAALANEYDRKSLRETGSLFGGNEVMV